MCGVGREVGAEVEYVCSKCGRPLTRGEYTGCPNCGSRARRMVSGGLTRTEGRSAPERPPSPLAAAQMLSLPPLAPVAMWRYLACFIGCTVAGIVILVSPLLIPVLPPPVDVLAGPCFMLCILGAISTCLVLLYKGWAAVQDGEARTTPAAAVLRCLIPVYNIYGLFQATVGFAHDFNRLAEHQGLEGVRARVRLYWTWYVCLWLTLIPVVAAVLLDVAFAYFWGPVSPVPLLRALCVSALAGLILLVLTACVISDMCEAINAIADASG